MRKRIFLVILFLFIYTISFIVFIPLFGDKSTVLALIPIVAISVMFGIRTGIISAFFFYFTNSLFLLLYDYKLPYVLKEHLPGAFASIFLAAAAGFLGDLQRKSRKHLEQLELEKKERIKAEEKLFEIQKLLQSTSCYEQPGNISKNIHDLNISEKLYREIAENAADIIYTVDTRGYFTYMNKMGLDNTGYSEEELYKYKYTDIILPGYVNSVKRFYLKQYAAGTKNSYLEFPFISKDGSNKWCGQNATLNIENGVVTGFTLIARDITNRKKMELDLLEREEQLRLITDTANEAIFTTDEEYRIVFWNKAAEHIYGYSREEIIGSSVEILMHEDEKKDFFEDREKDFDAVDHVFEKTGIRKDGTAFPIEVSLTRWKTGNKYFYTLIVRDISSRKEAELKLSQSEKDYRQLFMTAHEPIIVFTPEDEIVLEVNNTACQVYGFSREEFIGMSLKDISLDVQSGREKVNQTLTSGKLMNFQTTQFRKDGKKLFFEINASLIEYKGKTAILTINRDITEKLEREEKFKLMISAIENTSEVISLTDPHNKYLFVNKAFLSTYGYTEEEIIGNTPEILQSPRNSPELLQEIYTATNRGSWSGTLYNKRKDGNEFMISLNTSAVYDRDGNVFALLGIARDITAELRVREQIKQSEERYRILFENNPLPVIAFDSGNCNILSVNRAAVSVYGYTEEEFTRLNVSALINPSDNDPGGSLILKARGDASGKLVQVHRKNNGSIINVEISSYNIVLEGKNVTIYIINDITNALNIEREIMTQRDKAQQYLDISAVIMCVLDKNGNIILMNKTGCHILGYSEEEIKGKNWVELVYKKNEWEEYKRRINQIMFRNNLMYEYYESTILTNYGDEKIIAFHYTAIKDEDGQTPGILFSGEDITARKKAEKELDDYRNHLEKLVSERTEKLKEVNSQLFTEVKKLTEADEKIKDQIEFFQTLINTMPLPVFIKDKNKRYIDCNKAFEDFTGIKKSALTGKSVFDMYSKEDAEFYDKVDSKMLNGEKVPFQEITVINGEGRPAEVIVHMSALTKNDGSIQGLLGVILDISDQKELQREIKRSLDKEVELSELKSRFISVASHEFRTPLTTILASADLLEILGPKWDDLKFRGHISKIQNAVSYMTELIDDVLLINKAETGRISFSPETINLRELVAEVIENARAASTLLHSLSVSYELPEDNFMLDRKLLTQILSNLVSNAVKYSPKGGEVNLNVSQREYKLVFRISDNGIGISEEDLQHLFEPFHRGKNTGNITGTGLGLSIVKKAVDLHSGELYVDTLLGKGTTFSVFLPLSPSSEVTGIKAAVPNN